MIGKVLIALTLVLLTERSDAASLSAVDILTGDEELSQNNNQEVIELTKLTVAAQPIAILFGTGNASNFDVWWSTFRREQNLAEEFQ